LLFLNIASYKRSKHSAQITESIIHLSIRIADTGLDVIVILVTLESGESFDTDSPVAFS